MSVNLREFLVDWLNADPDNAFEALEHQDIRVAKDSKYPNLFCLKYGTIMADKSADIVCACRGAVVERTKSGKFELRAYAFDRFFNLGEGYAAKIDWDSAKVLSKEDGSLIKLFFYKGDWIVSTSGSVAGSSEVGTTGRSFAELFWAVFEEVGYDREKLDTNLVYIFELCHRDNRIVVDYPDPKLPLLAVRDVRKNFDELPLEDFSNVFNVVESYDLDDQEGVVKFVEDGSRGTAKGVVVVDKYYNRIKIKSSFYCQLHRVKGNNEPSFSELFLNDDLEEFLLHFPEYKDEFQKHLDKLSSYEEKVNRVVSQWEHLDQKDFARKVFELAPEVSGACFSIRSGKYENFGFWLEDLTPKKLDSLLSI